MRDKRFDKKWHIEMKKETKQLLYNSIRIYDKRLSDIYKMYYIENKSQVYIGNSYGISKARAWQLIHKLDSDIIPIILKSHEKTKKSI